MAGNILPLLDVPNHCFPLGMNNDQKLLRRIRAAAKPEHGFFLVRHTQTGLASATFVLEGSTRYVGRWMLGRIRKHEVHPGRYEILIRRAGSCYYRSIDTMKDLADELRFMDADADAELGQGSGDWATSPDRMFQEIGFTYLEIA